MLCGELECSSHVRLVDRVRQLPVERLRQEEGEAGGQEGEDAEGGEGHQLGRRGVQVLALEN